MGKEGKIVFAGEYSEKLFIILYVLYPLRVNVIFHKSYFKKSDYVS